MKQLFLALIIGFIGFSMVAVDAEARRLGGGRSLGKSLFKPKQTQRAPTQQRQQAAPSRNNAARSGASRWLGPLAGLVAGGLIASMLFGDGFEGFQFMDFLIIIALVFGAIWLFKTLRGNRGPQPTMRQAHATEPAVAEGDNRSSGFAAPEIGSGLDNNSDNESALRSAPLPGWFNEQEFLQGAKSHFIRLQAAWDVGDMKDIRDYTTPELFAELTLERQSYQGEDPFTEVVELNAELAGFMDEGDKVTASVLYSGLIREQRDADAKPFTETWHVQRASGNTDANWYVAGIQQETA